jgi:hypothetical protein
VTGLGMYGCPLCNEPPPHSHDLGTILNARYYCPDAVETGQYEYGPRHQWGPPSRVAQARALHPLRLPAAQE